MSARVINLVKRYYGKSGSVSFWHLPIELENQINWIGSYPFNFTSKLRYEGPFDVKGIPLLDYKGDTGIQYNPCAISQYGIGCIQLLEKNQKLITKVMSIADWITNWSIIDENGDLWLPYKFSIPEFNLNTPFFSGLAQANAASFFLMLSVVLDNSEYLNVARKLINPMLIPIENGGMLRVDKSGFWIIEEFVLNKQSAVLDGWMFSVLTLAQLAKLEPSNTNINNFEWAFASLENYLNKYDLKFWSRTDLYIDFPPMPSSLYYHNLHCIQLSALATFKKSDIFNHYCKKWSIQNDSRFCRVFALIYKIFMKLIKY